MREDLVNTLFHNTIDGDEIIDNYLDVFGYRGFRIVAPVFYYLPDFVDVGDPGNTADTNGYGSVDYEFKISKFTVTNQQYVQFLNSQAQQNDQYALYHSRMTSDDRGGIIRSGSYGAYTYSTKPNMANKPVIAVNWFMCARYCNWLYVGNTENGSYTLNGVVVGNKVAPNINASYRLPNIDEWYKAAYYKGGGINTGYWKYATQSNTPPVPVCATTNGDGDIYCP
jgi:hypothetical protein